MKKPTDTTTKTFLVTGSAGFIGFHLAQRLLREGHTVHGIDSMVNSYYDPLLKKVRLRELEKEKGYTHHHVDLADIEAVELLADKIGHIDRFIHMAAQACVLYSFDHPHKYSRDNMVAFQNMLEWYRKSDATLFSYASSSSVYGQSKEGTVITESKQTDLPVSIYGATKIANEAMAQAYYSYVQKPIVGFRFFKVYGPWARPDTVFFKFTDLMYRDQPIKLHNHGNIRHSFTYIDDVADAVIKTSLSSRDNEDFTTRHPIYNLGGSHALLLDCVDAIEDAMGKKAIREMVPLPAGDRWYTFADSSLAEKEIGFKNNTSIQDGLRTFVEWYLSEFVPVVKDVETGSIFKK